METKTVLRTNVRNGGNEWETEYPCKHQSGFGAFVHYSALQLPFSDQIHFSETETADRCILMSFLVKTYAKTELLAEERGAFSLRMCGRGKIPAKSTGNCVGHRNAYGTVVHCNGNFAEQFLSFILKGSARTSCVTREHHRKRGHQKPMLYINCGNIFSPFRSKPQITHNANNSE